METVSQIAVIAWFLCRQTRFVVAFLSLARIFGECSTIYSPLALFFPFKEVEISSHTLIPLFIPGSVHSDSVTGSVLPDKNR